jgi:hypothetical protein
VQAVLASHLRVVGKPLLVGLSGRDVWSGDFALLTHRGDAQAMLNYGNRFALDLWECDWDQFTATPSSATAPQEGRAERAAMMQQVVQGGFVCGYDGQRVSRTGRVFLIQDVTIWRLLDEKKQSFGIAAFFRRYQRL